MRVVYCVLFSNNNALPVTFVNSVKEAMENNKSVLAQQCCLLYYAKRKGQQEIADMLGISRAYVSRLLSYALDEKLVEIEVKLSNIGLRDTGREVELHSSFGKLKKVYILKSTSVEFSVANIGLFTVDCIGEYIHNAENIGLSLGLAVERTIEALGRDKPRHTKKKHLIQLMGNLGANGNAYAQPHDVLSSLSKKLSAEAHFLSAPIFVKDQGLRDQLLGEGGIADTCRRWESIDLALLGIEDSVVDSKLSPLIGDEGQSQIDQQHAVGNVAAVYFDKTGRHTPILDDKKIAISYEALMNIENKVIIGHGPSKVNALRAALQGGLIDVLVTDSLTCDAILSPGAVM